MRSSPGIWWIAADRWIGEISMVTYNDWEVIGSQTNSQSLSTMCNQRIHFNYWMIYQKVKTQNIQLFFFITPNVRIGVADKYVGNCNSSRKNKGRAICNWFSDWWSCWDTLNGFTPIDFLEKLTTWNYAPLSTRQHYHFKELFTTRKFFVSHHFSRSSKRFGYKVQIELTILSILDRSNNTDEYL